MPRVFIFIHSGNIGGAEKRFAGLWKSIQELQIACHLVVLRQLYERFSAGSDMKQVVEENSDKVFFLDTSAGSFRKQYKRFIKENTSAGDILHFVGEHPFLRLTGTNQVFSITQSSLKNMNLFGRAGQFIGTFLSTHTDVLDPGIFRLMKKIFFYKQKRISLTTNSFCDIHTYQFKPFDQKKDWLVFLGRFEEMKQVIELMQALPHIHKVLQPIATKDLHYYFIGHGSQETPLKEIAERKEYNNIPLTIMYHENPWELLSQSKIFFSLQWHNNYPSRSLIEAMATGNIPLATDVGETRWLAKPEFSYYVPEHFTTDQLVEQVKKIFALDNDVLKQKSLLARKTVEQEHTIGKMREYYLNIYRSLSK